MISINPLHGTAATYHWVQSPEGGGGTTVGGLALVALVVVAYLLAYLATLAGSTLLLGSLVQGFRRGFRKGWDESRADSQQPPQ